MLHLRSDMQDTFVAMNINTLDSDVNTVTTISRPSAHAHSIQLSAHIPCTHGSIHAQYVPMLTGEGIARETKTWSAGFTLDF